MVSCGYNVVEVFVDALLTSRMLLQVFQGVGHVSDDIPADSEATPADVIARPRS